MCQKCCQSLLSSIFPMKNHSQTSIVPLKVNFLFLWLRFSLCLQFFLCLFKGELERRDRGRGWERILTRFHAQNRAKIKNLNWLKLNWLKPPRHSSYIFCFRSFSNMYPEVWVFIFLSFIFLGIGSASSICVLMSFISLGNFSAVFLPV